jgi:hypothetical protein
MKSIMNSTELKPLSKNEKKLLKASLKLESITKKYLTGLMEVDEVIQDLPVGLAREHRLEENYFKHVIKIIQGSVQMELLNARVQKGLTRFIPAPEEQESLTEYYDSLELDESL